MVFFEGVDVRHPLTVINSKFSQSFLNFPNRFSMKKIHKTGYKKLSTLNCLEWNVESFYCFVTIYIHLKCNEIVIIYLGELRNRSDQFFPICTMNNGPFLLKFSDYL